MLEARAFEPDFLKRLDHLAMAVRQTRAIRAGQRTLGRVLGSGLELENYKEYTEGDDLRFLDWNAYARLDDLMIRTYRAEREVEITALVDASASMCVPAGDDKLGLGLALAASAVYLAMASNDAVRIVGFSGRRGAVRLQRSQFHRRRENYIEFRSFVTQLKGEGLTRMTSAVDEYLLERRRAGVVLLISDFLVNAADYETALSHLLAAGHAVKVIHVLGQQEHQASYPDGLYRVRDCESGELREVVMSLEGAAGCRKRVEELSARIKRFCEDHAIFYARAFGAPNFEAIVAREFPRLGVIR